MSYCVQCGVELSKYQSKCPLCETDVVNPNIKVIEANSDYPDYKVVAEEEKKKVKRYVTGIILSIQVFVYSVIVLIIDLLVDGTISWSIIPILSLTLLWFGVAYPFFRAKNTFFRLFTYDCIAVMIFLVALNYAISSNFIWSRFTTVSIMILWVIIAGIFITDRIRKVLPVTIFYIVCSVILSIAMVLFINTTMSFLFAALPIIGTVFILSLISYFIYKSSSSGVLGLIMMVLVDASLLCVIIDLSLHYYLVASLGVSWSILVIGVLIPAASTLFAIKKSSELNTIISKKLHR